MTPRWIVIQNHTGQQYPIAVKDLGEFLVRWPSSVNALGDRSIVEAIGPDIGNSVLQTEHIDVFEGADQALVAPTFQSLFQNNPQVTAIDSGLNRFTSPWNYGSQYMLYGWAYPVSPAAVAIPSRLHVVGNAINRSPLQLSIPPGNNIATVIPAAGEQFRRDPGHSRGHRLRPQGRLRLPPAASDHAEGTPSHSIRPIQDDPIPAVGSREVIDETSAVGGKVDPLCGHEPDRSPRAACPLPTPL